MGINELIDASLKCTMCSALKSVGCKCWVTLKCDCGYSEKSLREKDDPPHMDEFNYTPCPKCAPPVPLRKRTKLRTKKVSG